VFTPTIVEFEREFMLEDNEVVILPVHILQPLHGDPRVYERSFCHMDEEVAEEEKDVETVVDS
jgi:hypothetical protein